MNASLPQQKVGLILIVDDEQSQRELLSQVLSGFLVLAVDSVAAALEAARKTTPAVVLMDYSMPEVDGIEGLKELRKLCPKVPVIMLTGHAELEVAREAIQLGAVEYMIKPFEPADLISVISRSVTPAGRDAVELPHNAHRRMASNIDLWRSRLPTVASENRIAATLEGEQRVEAKVLRLSQTRVQAEVYDPMLRLEAEQRVARLQIWVGDDAAYDGAAHLDHVITTGVSRICEFTLAGDWMGGHKEEDGQPTAHRIEGATQEFINKWHASRDIRPAFKLAVAEAADFLTELRAWLEGQELQWRRSSDASKSLSRVKLEELMHQIGPEMDQAFALFEAEAARIPHELMGLHAEYFRACLDPLLLCAPFIHRCYTKPLGYPGDFGMMNMMLDDPFQGTSVFAKVVNAWVILSAAGDAYRHRVVYLEKMLGEEVARVQSQGRVCHVLSLGCGAAKEVQQFILNNPASENCSFTLLDFSSDTIGYATKQVTDAMTASGRHLEVSTQEFSVQQMLARGGRIVANPRMARSGPLERGKYDVLYCAGLFDYLSERVCARLLEIFWELAAPGAAIVASNFNPVNPIRGFMDYALDWRLIYREEDEVRALAVHEAEGSEPQTFRSPDRVEVFLRMRKPAHEILLCGAQPGGDEALRRVEVSASE